MTGATVALCGVIGFVGLVVPHVFRLAGTGRGQPLPVPRAPSVVAALLCEYRTALARTIAAPAELPIGVITVLRRTHGLHLPVAPPSGTRLVPALMLALRNITCKWARNGPGAAPAMCRPFTATWRIGHRRSAQRRGQEHLAEVDGR